MSPELLLDNNNKTENSNNLNNNSEYYKIISFLHLVQHLKINKRNGWLNMGIKYENTESIADHMYRMSIMAQVIKDSSIDKFKAIKMALVHDMAEAITGDITPADGISFKEKNRLETDAMQKIKSILGNNSFGDEALMLWKEYADDETVEARFVKDLDKLELIFQVIEYEKSEGINFESWILGSKDKIRHSEMKEILNQLLMERMYTLK